MTTTLRATVPPLAATDGHLSVLAAPSRRPAAFRREPCDLEIVIPAYNEEGRLGATLAEIVRELRLLQDATPLHCRIVVVDNGSADRTSEVVDRALERAGASGSAAAMAPGTPDVVVVGCAIPGKGAAVTRGMVTSDARVVGFVDADLSVSPAVLGAAVGRIVAGADVVIASRRCAGATYEVKQPPTRRLGGWAFRTMIRSLVPGVADSQCGFKFFSRRAAAAIFGDMDVTGFAFDVEVLMRAVRAGYAVQEMPVAWSDDTSSTLGLASHAPEIARDIRRLHRLGAALDLRARFEPRAVVGIERSALGSMTDALQAAHTAVSTVATFPTVAAAETVAAVPAVRPDTRVA